jgi:glycine/D-amino acid oxidase-like deaminating enzyme
MDPGQPDKYPLPSWWLQSAKNSLSNFQSTPQLPNQTDILIVGAGYTGARTAYHLSKLLVKDYSITVLDARGVAEGATGRNGEHLIPYNHRNILRDAEIFWRGLCIMAAGPRMGERARDCKVSLRRGYVSAGN